MPTIEVILHKVDRPDERLSIYFNLLETPIAKKHFVLFQKHCQNQVPVNPDRTFNFPGDTRDNDWIVNQLNECIDMINSHFFIIKHRAFSGMDQIHMNELHKYFERFRGPILSPSKFYVTAPYEVKKAHSDFNSLIHRYEDYNRNLELVQNGHVPAAKIILNFSHFERLPLADEDFEQFSTRVIFGRYYLNYCEIGKPILDMYHDNDKIVGGESILPLRYYSADALIEFSQTSSEENDIKNMTTFYDWWDANKTMMDELGFTKYDPKNAIGHIPLADLDRNRGAIANKTENEIRELLGQYPILAGTKVIPED